MADEMAGKKKQTLGGSIRVSRKNGRAGDSYLTVKFQDDAIKRGATTAGVNLEPVLVEEDVSGARRHATTPPVLGQRSGMHGCGRTWRCFRAFLARAIAKAESLSTAHLPSTRSASNRPA